MSPDRSPAPRWQSFFRLDLLLVFVPVAVALRYVPGWEHPTALFVASALGLIPLAGWMGRATEEIAHHLGQGIGGLLNATFGNAAELIIALVALQAGKTEVVKASIIGSIVGNLLLVLGAAVFAGGLRFPQQRFNQTGARASCTALMLAASALVVPTVFRISSNHAPHGWSAVAAQNLSLALALVLLATYVALLIFSLGTHRNLFAGETPDEDSPAGHAAGARPAGFTVEGSLRNAIIVLGAATAAVAWLSEFLVGSVEAARTSLGVTELFVGVIVVAIVGNAAEHSTAVTVALKDKMDLALGIAVGSSLQIALFVAPVLIFASYAFGRPLSLEFSLPEVAAVVAATW